DDRRYTSAVPKSSEQDIYDARIAPRAIPEVSVKSKNSREKFG
ncbi:24103_t:CDS:2, partial [Racocetra persica]